MAISPSVFLSELTFQRSSVVKVVDIIISIFRKTNLVSTKHWAANTSGEPVLEVNDNKGIIEDSGARGGKGAGAINIVSTCTQLATHAEKKQICG